MPMTPGYYMPNMYYGANSMTPAPNYQQQSYSPPPQPQNQQGIIWVDGEVGAKAFQMPAGIPAGAPVPLWDTNEPVIYLKSMNQMGMPNPLQKIHYTMEENKNQPVLPAGQMSGAPAQDGVRYATKDDLEQMKNEIREMLRSNQPKSNQNGSQNRGGNP